jgi:hypothetical protein
MKAILLYFFFVFSFISVGPVFSTSLNNLESAKTNIKQLGQAICYAKKSLAKEAALCELIARTMGRVFIVSLVDDLESAEYKTYSKMLAELKKTDAMTDVLKPALPMIYKVFAKEFIMQKMTEFMVKNRDNLAKIYTAKSITQNYLENPDENALKESDALVTSILADPAEKILDPILTTMIEIVEKSTNIKNASKKLEVVELLKALGSHPLR